MALRCHQSESQSDPFVAEHCGVSHDLVRAVRSEVTLSVTCDSKPRKGKDGKSYAPSSEKRAAGQAYVVRCKGIRSDEIRKDLR